MIINQINQFLILSVAHLGSEVRLLHLSQASLSAPTVRCDAVQRGIVPAQRHQFGFPATEEPFERSSGTEAGSLLLSRHLAILLIQAVI